MPLHLPGTSMSGEVEAGWSAARSVVLAPMRAVATAISAKAMKQTRYPRLPIR